jgi:DNA-binding beta-propeller fold protein YncE
MDTHLHIAGSEEQRESREVRTWLRALAFVFLLGAGAGMCADTGAKRPLVSRPQILTGAQLTNDPAGVFQGIPRPPLPGMPPYLSFISPVAVAARNNIVYVVDAGHRQVFRYDPARLSMMRFADTVGGTASALAVGPDLSLYVAEVGTGQVQHYSWDGRPLPAFRHDTAMRQPVGIVADDASGRVFIADSLYNHVVVFTGFGRALTILRPDEARSIESMARGPDGLYLVDAIGRQVVVMAFDGADLYAFGSEALKMPHAIVVDRFNRVYVSDDFDNTIKVFEDRELIATIGGGGGGAGQANFTASFNRIAFLSLDQNTLYVADSLNGRIQSFQLAPVPARRPAAE